MTKTTANANANAKTWILVADSARARLFETTSPGDTLSEVACFANPYGRSPGRSETTDHLPSVNESMGATRHSIEPHTTLREKHADQFARSLNDALERGDADHRFEQLVLVAPPRFLGALHGTASKTVQKRVVGEVKRNLTALPASDIQARLPRNLAISAG